MHILHLPSMCWCMQESHSLVWKKCEHLREDTDSSEHFCDSHFSIFDEGKQIKLTLSHAFTHLHSDINYIMSQTTSPIEVEIVPDWGGVVMGASALEPRTPESGRRTVLTMNENNTVSPFSMASCIATTAYYYVHFCEKAQKWKGSVSKMFEGNETIFFERHTVMQHPGELPRKVYF